MNPASNPTRKRQRGFTLIEIMVAMLIMGIISLLSWRALDSTSRAAEHLNRTTEETLQLIRTFDQMERDVAWRATVEMPSEPADGAADTMALTPSISVQRMGQGVRVEVIRTSTNPGHWQRVQWWRTGSTLYRAAAPPADTYPLPAPADSTAAAAMQDIMSFDVRGLQAGRGWVTLPSATATAQMLALEITITQGTPSQPIRYRRVLALK